MLVCWVPVCLGIGIGSYFRLPAEPTLVIWVAGAFCVLSLLVLWRFTAEAYAPLVMGLMLVLVGMGIAKYRVTALEAPVLGFRYYGPIEGRVVGIDRSASDAVRLTLDQVVLSRMSVERTPSRVRVSLHGDQPFARFTPGDVLILTGHLSPPSGPAEPGGFDFQRHAWFLQLGAVGYTRTPVLRLSVPQTQSLTAHIFAMRMAISHAVQDAMQGETGAFAAAIMTGDRSGMGQGTLVDLRASNLAHLLAISGLHMGLLTGFIFALVRYGLAMVPFAALRWPTKKFAAVFALVVGAFYLALSGGNVATERAFIMVAVMLVAVLLNRRALTLRAVAIAAIIVLLWQPEALIGPGFQMSFAATTALVVVFGGLRRIDLRRLPKWTRPILSVFMSSLIAGLATAPFAAVHFNQLSHYGLIANLLSVPLMGLLIMPAAVLAVCLAPLGLWHFALWFVDKGLEWILFVAQSVSGLDGALSHVKAPQSDVLPLMAIGLLGLILIRGRVRLAGGIAVATAAILWVQTTRPTVLIADNGSLVGLQTDAGRALSKARGSGFVAGIWLENDGAPFPQEVAAQRGGLSITGRQVELSLAQWQITQVSGKTALAALDGCGGADVLISNQEVTELRPCTVFDVTRLRQTGALGLSLTADGDLHIETAQARSGDRPWNPRLTRLGQSLTLLSSQRKRAAEATLASGSLQDQ